MVKIRDFKVDLLWFGFVGASLVSSLNSHVFSFSSLQVVWLRIGVCCCGDPQSLARLVGRVRTKAPAFTGVFGLADDCRSFFFFFFI